jgi:uncharacterized alkaline shock family protein YloU
LADESMTAAGAPGTEVGLARAVAEAVRAVPGIAEVSPGQFAERATYGPGEKVPGIVVDGRDDGLAIEVHVCAHYTNALVLPELAARVRTAVRQTVEARDKRPIRRVDVAFDDVLVA